MVKFGKQNQIKRGGGLLRLLCFLFSPHAKWEGRTKNIKNIINCLQHFQALYRVIYRKRELFSHPKRGKKTQTIVFLALNT